MKPNHNLAVMPLIKTEYEKRNGVIMQSLPMISRMLKGFEKGELVVITGAPSSGKTQLARTFSMDIIKQGGMCLYLSYEQNYGQLLEMFEDSGLNKEDGKYLMLRPVDSAENDITFAEEIAATEGLDCLIVDDIHALEEKYRFQSRTDNMGIVMRGLAQRLKTAALKNNVLIITMAHQKKDSLDNSASSLSDIAYSAGIAQVADTVMSIKRKPESSTLEITKSRWSGKRGKIEIRDQDKIFKEIPADEQNPTELVNNVFDNARRKLPMS